MSAPKNMAEVREAFDSLREDVSAAGGVKSVQMGELRDLIGAGRLDKGPLARIESALEAARLGSIDLDSSQSTYVLVYEVDSPVGRVVATVGSYAEDADKQLLEALAAVNADDSTPDPRLAELDELREVIAQVRAIVGTDE